jgi:RNA polymerase sigma factor (sigma-70 family)
LPVSSSRLGTRGPQQDAAGAIEHFTKATALAPSYTAPYNQMGYAYRQVADYANAEKAFKKYIELIPNDPNPYDSYAELLPRVYNYFRYRLGNEADAEDLTSITFEKAWSARHRYRRDLAAFTTWLLTIARNVAIDHHRRAAVDVDSLFDNHVERIAVEDIGRVDDRRRIQSFYAGARAPPTPRPRPRGEKRCPRIERHLRP